MQANDTELAAIAEARRPSLLFDDEKGKDAHYDSTSLSASSDNEGPTEEEIQTLRRVSGKIPWQAYTVALVEFCERFSWYGTTAVFVNFIQQPLPPGSIAGAINTSPGCWEQFGRDVCEQPGALGADQRTSTALTTFNQFWAYVCPLIGGWIADEFLGRYKTIQWAILFAVIGHVLLIVSSIPSVIEDQSTSLGLFAFGLVVLGIGTGGFKSNISPLLAEQLKDRKMEVITIPAKAKGGTMSLLKFWKKDKQAAIKPSERVLRDPAVTVSRVYLYFYFLINLGSLTGGIGMVYAERYIGFWLAYALPTFLFFFCPLILLSCRKRYNHMPPAGSVLSKAFKLLALASKGKWSINPIRTYSNFKAPNFWNAVKPSALGANAPQWMVGIDDAWVDQVKRGFAACRVFLWYPLYWLAYNQMVNNLTSQSATMQLNGVPNDIINNLNPLTLVIFIPLMDAFFYPTLRRFGIKFTPIKRITFGFGLASASMISAAVTQYYIYKLGACPDSQTNEPGCGAPINVWVQAVPYCLIAFSEIFASITGLEYAFTKAPENMRSLVMGVNLLQNAFAAAIGQALVPLADDPLLIWNYGVVAVLAAAGGLGFWLTWRTLDAQEDELNNLPATLFKGRRPSLVEAQGGDVEKL